MLQNIRIVLIISTNDLILNGYHKSGNFWEEFEAILPIIIIAAVVVVGTYCGV
jgi:hypothetical protein